MTKIKIFAVFIFFTALLISPYTQAQVDNSGLNIVPYPNEVKVLHGNVKIPTHIRVFFDQNIHGDFSFVLKLLEKMGLKSVLTQSRALAHIEVMSASLSTDESYEIAVGEPNIKIKASHYKGVVYAVQTLRQIARKQTHHVNFRKSFIRDTPAYPWRSYLLDEGRHFQGVKLVKNILDEMSQLKLNVFHWHLIDDSGWRLEIKKYPLLTTIGAKKDFTYRYSTVDEWDALRQEKSYYTQEEVKELIRYASDRGIQIVPEIAFPGHATAAIFAYPWLGTLSQCGHPYWPDTYNVTKPKVWSFIKDVLDEVVTLFPSEVIHIGGDEVRYTDWAKSDSISSFMKSHHISSYPNLQIWSINQLSTYLESKGKRLMGWNEITGEHATLQGDVKNLGSLSPKSIIQFWVGDISLLKSAVNKGFEVVNSKNSETYLDFSYETISLKKAYNFDPVLRGELSSAQRKLIKGIGCQMWGELTPNNERVYFQTFPRLAAYAEVGWTREENKNFDDFISRLHSYFIPLWRNSGFISRQPIN